MKKALILLLAIIVLISCTFVACSNKDENNNDNTEVTGGLDSADEEFGFETQPVTDDNGKEVTDENGKVVTTEVAVIYKKDKNGNEYAVPLDSNGEPVTDKKGNEVTIKLPDAETTTTKKDKNNSASSDGSGNTTTTAPKPTGTTNKKAENTTANTTTAPTKADKATENPTKEQGSKRPTSKDPDPTTTTKKAESNSGVPKTSDNGTEVNFSQEDQEIIKSMLEVPYLYLASYENSDGVPIEIATHTAVWMAEHEGSPRTVYPSSPVVLNLFKYYGQTVVNFKTKCNDFAEKANAPIRYIKKDDTFEITNYTSKVQTVTITKIEDLGNNYYKITADVKGCKKDNVIAIVQQNRLEATLGFSIKALRWS